MKVKKLCSNRAHRCVVLKTCTLQILKTLSSILTTEKNPQNLQERNPLFNAIFENNAHSSISDDQQSNFRYDMNMSNHRSK